MSVAIRAEADSERARLVPAGTFDVAHASAGVRAVEQARRELMASGDVDLHLSVHERIDGSGALLLARLIDRLEARGHRTRLIDDHNLASRSSFAKRGKSPPRRRKAASCLWRILFEAGINRGFVVVKTERTLLVSCPGRN
jgi:anti-anti-sigma regulatory factor